MSGKGSHNINAAIKEHFSRLPQHYTRALGSRIDLTGACLMKAAHALALDVNNNKILRRMCTLGLFSNMVSFKVPRNLFVGDTLAIDTTESSGVLDVYTSYLPKMDEDKMKEKIMGGGYSEATDMPTKSSGKKDGESDAFDYHSFAKFTSGDPANIQVPIEQANNLLRFFFMIPFMASHLHENISCGESGINDIISKHSELANLIRKTQDSGNVAANGTSWFDILTCSRDNAGIVTDNTLDSFVPWSPMIIEEVYSNEEPDKVNALRFVCFINRKHRSIQTLVKNYIQELGARVKFNSEAEVYLGELIKKANGASSSAAQQAVPAVNNGRGNGINAMANRVAGAANEMESENRRRLRVLAETQDTTNDAIRIIIQTCIKSWEEPLLRATRDEYNPMLYNGSTRLATSMQKYLRAGDNIIFPVPNRTVLTKLNDKKGVPKRRLDEGGRGEDRMDTDENEFEEKAAETATTTTVVTVDGEDRGLNGNNHNVEDDDDSENEHTGNADDSGDDDDGGLDIFTAHTNVGKYRNGINPSRASSSSSATNAQMDCNFDYYDEEVDGEEEKERQQQLKKRNRTSLLSDRTRSLIDKPPVADNRLVSIYPTQDEGDDGSNSNNGEGGDEEDTTDIDPNDKDVKYGKKSLLIGSDGKLNMNILNSTIKSASTSLRGPQNFSDTRFLPSADLSAFTRANTTHPLDNNSDPRTLVNIFHPMHTFYAYTCTSSVMEQENPFCYFTFDAGTGNKTDAMHASKVAPYNFPFIYNINNINVTSGDMEYDSHDSIDSGGNIIYTKEHKRWQCMREEERYMRECSTYGGIVTKICDNFADTSVGFDSVWRTFKGFPMSSIKRGRVHVILPDLMPFEYNLMPLPHVIKNNQVLDIVSSVFSAFASSKTIASCKEYIRDLYNNSKSDNGTIMAALYMVLLSSNQVIINDAMRCGLPVPVISLATTVTEQTREFDIESDVVSIPDGDANISRCIEESFNFLLERRKGARFAMVFSKPLETRIAYETELPHVRQPGERDLGNDSIDPGVRVAGLDVYISSGETVVKYHNIIEQMCSHEVALSEQGVDEVTKLSNDMQDRGMDDNTEILKRTARFAVKGALRTYLESIQRSLLIYTTKVHAPPVGSNKQAHKHTYLAKYDVISEMYQYPKPYLPMPHSLACVFKEFNSLPSSERWTNVNNAEYLNTTPTAELYAGIANEATIRHQVFSNVQNFILLHTAYSSIAMYNRNLNGARLHMVLAGGPGTTKSYNLKIFKQSSTPGVVVGSSNMSEKADTAYVNLNATVDIRDELPSFLVISPDKAGGANLSTAVVNQAEKWKDNADMPFSIYYSLSTTRQDSEGSSREYKGYRDLALNVSLSQNVYLWSTNRHLGRMQDAVRSRVLIINSVANQENKNTIPGSQMSDQTLHDRDAFSNTLHSNFRTNHFYTCVLQAYCHLNPLHAPDVYDAKNLVGTALRNSKKFMPKNQFETRRDGKIGVFIKSMCYQYGKHMGLRDLTDDGGKYAPCIPKAIMNSSVTKIGRKDDSRNDFELKLRHMDVNKFLNRSVGHLVANKELGILTLTLLKDILESPIRAGILQHFAQLCYPKGSILEANFKKIAPARNANLRLGGGGNGGGGNGGDNMYQPRNRNRQGQEQQQQQQQDPVDDDTYDWNIVIHRTSSKTKSALCTQLGKVISVGSAYSEQQVQFVLDEMCTEKVDIEPENDQNIRLAPLEIETQKSISNQRIRKEEDAKQKKLAKKQQQQQQQQQRRETSEEPEEDDDIGGNGNQMTSDELMLQSLNDNPELFNRVNQQAPGMFANAVTAAATTTTTSTAVVTANKLRDFNASKEVIEKYTAMSKIQGSKNRTTLNLIEFSDSGGYIEVSIPHVELRKFYKDTSSSSVSRLKKAGGVYLDAADTLFMDANPFELSEIWRAIRNILASHSLEKYPTFITDKFLDDPASVRRRQQHDALSPSKPERHFITKEGVKYFNAGEFSYITGRTDAINFYAKPIIKSASDVVDNFIDKVSAENSELKTSYVAALVEKKKENKKKKNKKNDSKNSYNSDPNEDHDYDNFDEYMEGRESYEEEEGGGENSDTGIKGYKERYRMPTCLQSKWLMYSPVVKRPQKSNYQVGYMQLPCIMDIKRRAFSVHDSEEDIADIVGRIDEEGRPVRITKATTHEKLDVMTALKNKKNKKDEKGGIGGTIKLKPTSETGIIEIYRYDLDYIAMLRRCVRLGLDINKYWINIPIFRKMQKLKEPLPDRKKVLTADEWITSGQRSGVLLHDKYNGRHYPESIYTTSLSHMAESIIKAVKSTFDHSKSIIQSNQKKLGLINHKNNTKKIPPPVNVSNGDDDDDVVSEVSIRPKSSNITTPSQTLTSAKFPSSSLKQKFVPATQQQNPKPAERIGISLELDDDDDEEKTLSLMGFLPNKKSKKSL